MRLLWTAKTATACSWRSLMGTGDFYSLSVHRLYDNQLHTYEYEFAGKRLRYFFRIIIGKQCSSAQLWTANGEIRHWEPLSGYSQVFVYTCEIIIYTHTLHRRFRCGSVHQSQNDNKYAGKWRNSPKTSAGQQFSELYERFSTLRLSEVWNKLISCRICKK